MGLGGWTGNGMNWMAVKALGQSALLVMWDIVNRLLLDFSWTHTFFLLSGATLCFLDNMKEFKRDAHLQLIVTLTGLSNRLVSHVPAATKADGFALYFLGECNNVSAEAG